jgi:hypothetical protein
VVVVAGAEALKRGRVMADDDAVHAFGDGAPPSVVLTIRRELRI